MKTNPNDPIGFVDGGDGVRVPMGLTKREMIAAMALQGMLANSNQDSQDPANASYNYQLAVRYADALIDELNREETSTTN